MNTRTLEVKGGLLTITADDIDYDKGAGIYIRVKGFHGNNEEPPDDRTQILLEYFEGKLKVHVWNDSNSSVYDHEIEPRPQYKKVMRAKKKNLPLLLNIKDPDAQELLRERLTEKSKCH
jgi:lipoate synthase